MPAQASLTSGGDWVVPVETLSDAEIDQLAASFGRELKQKRDQQRAGHRGVA